MSLPRYDSYKDSGVEWLGEVPSHWETKRLGQYFTERREKVSDKDFLPLSVTKNGIVPQLDTAAKTDDGDNRKKVCAGDFVINSRSDRKGSSGLSSLDGSVSLINTVIEPSDKLYAPYVHHLLRSTSFQEEYYRYGKGIVADLWSTNYSEMKDIILAVPSLTEQKEIAGFLDRETGKIDALVAEQERLIALLAEKRQAVISHAVTKGLNPTAPMKPSGIDWLGDIPKHWCIHKIKSFASFTGGGTPNRDTPDFWNGDIPWVSPKDMKVEKIVGAEECITALGLAGSSSSLIPAGSLLMVVRSGILQHTIPVAINEIPVALNQDMKAIKFDPELCLSRFFMRWIQGLNDPLLLVWGKQGATVESIEHDYLARTAVPLPSPDEQIKIIQYLDTELGKFDALILKAQMAITLLQERRTALISAAVTGKIDVRSQARKEKAA